MHARTIMPRGTFYARPPALAISRGGSCRARGATILAPTRRALAAELRTRALVTTLLAMPRAILLDEVRVLHAARPTPALARLVAALARGEA